MLLQGKHIGWLKEDGLSSLYTKAGRWPRISQLNHFYEHSNLQKKRKEATDHRYSQAGSSWGSRQNWSSTDLFSGLSQGFVVLSSLSSVALQCPLSQVRVSRNRAGGRHCLSMTYWCLQEKAFFNQRIPGMYTMYLNWIHPLYYSFSCLSPL